MAMDVMIGIIKYKPLENVKKTGLEIIKIRENPEHVTETLEGKREFYSIDFGNKRLTPVDGEALNKQVQRDIDKSKNDKRFIEEKKEEITSEPFIR